MQSNCPDCGRFGESVAVTLSLEPYGEGRVETFFCSWCELRWVDGATGTGDVVRLR